MSAGTYEIASPRVEYSSQYSRPKVWDRCNRLHISTAWARNSCFLWSNLQEDTVKVLHESGPILHEGGPAQRMVLKAISKMGSAAS